jgi:hypothetical protein
MSEEATKSVICEHHQPAVSIKGSVGPTETILLCKNSLVSIGDLTGWNWTRLLERIDLEQGATYAEEEVQPRADIATLRQIEVQLAQGKSIALACKDAAISEQSSGTSA